MNITEDQLIRSIDQTNLRPGATPAEMEAFTVRARSYGFRTIAIMPVWIPFAAPLLHGSPTTIVAAIDFPFGTSPSSAKVAEAAWSMDHGPADIEIDMVMNVPLIKSMSYAALESDMRAVIEAARGHIVKVIIEVSSLTQHEIVIASLIAERAGADYIKTSTGFKALPGWRPSTTGDVKLIRSAVGTRVGIKVAGGISTLAQAIAILEAGASRIGTSAGDSIVDSFREQLRDRHPRAAPSPNA